MKVTFELERETKNTYRYKETENDANVEVAIGTLYIKKVAMKAISPTEPAKKITVTIEKA